MTEFDGWERCAVHLRNVRMVSLCPFMVTHRRAEVAILADEKSLVALLPETYVTPRAERAFSIAAQVAGPRAPAPSGEG